MNFFKTYFGKDINLEQLARDCCAVGISFKFKQGYATMIECTSYSGIYFDDKQARRRAVFAFEFLNDMSNAQLYARLQKSLTLESLLMPLTERPVLTDDERALAALARERLAVWHNQAELEYCTTRDNLEAGAIFHAWFERQFPFLSNEVTK